MMATAGSLLVFAVVADPRSELAWASRTAAAATLFASNLYLARTSGGYFTPTAESNPFLHTWSLSLEEQIYFVYPALVVAAGWMIRRASRTDDRLQAARFRMVAILVGLAIVSFSASLWLSFSFPPLSDSSVWTRLAFYSPLTRAWEFLAGALIAWGGVALRGNRTAIVARVAGLGTIAIAAAVFDQATRFPGVAALAPVVGAVLMLIPVENSTVVDRVLANTRLGWFGDISYSWYLWHWPAIVIVALMQPGSVWAVIAATGSLVPAVLSYRFLEVPIRSGQLFPDRVRGVVAAGVALPLVVVALVTIGGQRNWGMDVPDAWAERRLAGQLGCVDTESDEWSVERCTVDAIGEAKGLVFVVGDSHASSLSDGAASAFSELGYDTAFWARSGCPFLIGRTTIGNPGCAEWQSEVADLLRELSPVAVVVANRSAGYVLPDFPPGETWRTIGDEQGDRPVSQIDALDEWRVGVEQALHEVRTIGSRVLWVTVVPEHFDGFRISLVDRQPEPPTTPLSDVRARRGAVAAVESEVLSRVDGAMAYDPAEILCGPAECRAGTEDEWWYMDEHHLNPVGSRMLSESLLAAMVELLSAD